MNRVGLGLAVGAGYVLGRTKKMKLAFAVGTLVAGKRMHLSPRALADLASQQLRNNPQFKEIGDQLREDLRGVGKAASGAMVERQIDAVADRLHGRTAQVRDQLAGVVPDASGLGLSDERDEDEEPEEEYEEPEADEADEAQEADESDEAEEAEETADADEDAEPRRKPAAKKSARKATAKKSPARETARKQASDRAPAKKATAKKTAGKKTAAKKTTSARSAARGARARLPKGGAER
ncbi:DNA primase [Streptomyces sp. NBC_01352]|uniref:DNA primase n=1 Tax=unclassified Streptomyces TaxID=2593676 RepID=UPI002E316871|nr:DNA primase [Streptomyces sp. NBC_01352]